MINQTNKAENIIIMSETVDSITVKHLDDGDFKVLMFTDLHLSGTKKTDSITIEMLLKNIAEQKPQLVVFGGDTVISGFYKKRTRKFAEIMEKTGAFWTLVLGNHEGEGCSRFSRKEIIEEYSSYDHCLLKNGCDGVDGNGNCTINVLNADNTLKQVIFLLDSGNYMTKALKKKYSVKKKGQVYDGVKEAQVKWYKEKCDKIKAKYGDFNAFAVMHIPPYQCGNADEYEFLYGEKREGVCQSGFDSGFLDAVIEKGSTKAVFFGHDHINDFGYMYKDVLLSYIQASGYSAYSMQSKYNSPEKDWLQGCTVLTLNKNGTFKANRILNHAEK